VREDDSEREGNGAGGSSISGMKAAFSPLSRSIRLPEAVPGSRDPPERAPASRRRGGTFDLRPAKCRVLRSATSPLTFTCLPSDDVAPPGSGPTPPWLRGWRPAPTRRRSRNSAGTLRSRPRSMSTGTCARASSGATLSAQTRRFARLVPRTCPPKPCSYVVLIARCANHGDVTVAAESIEFQGSVRPSPVVPARTSLSGPSATGSRRSYPPTRVTGAGSRNPQSDGPLAAQWEAFFPSRSEVG